MFIVVGIPAEAVLSVVVIQFQTTYKNNNQKLSANIAKTGTKAKDINCFKLNFSKKPDHHSDLSKKYISQNNGEIIIYIHK
jgi:hypothetical protein